MLPHARRVLEKPELDELQKLYDDFKEAIDGTEGKFVPGDDPPGSAPNSSSGSRMGQKFNKGFAKRL